MKKRTAKRALKWIGITIGVLLIIIAAGAAVMFGPFVKAANSIEKLEDGLYAMEFAGDYGFDDFLANGAALTGLIDLVKQSGATLVGCGIAIEKAFQPGGANLRAQGVRIESLARVASMSEDEGVIFCD